MAMFIRGLWGDGLLPTHAKTLKDLRWTVRRKQHPEPMVTYCFGEQNATRLRRRRIRYKLLFKEEMPNFSESPLIRRRSKDHGRTNWGISMWRYKMICLKAAVEEYGEIVWLDWDCRLVRPLPDDFWQRLRQGAEFQTPLQCYFQLQAARWRKYHQRYLPHGCFIYARDTAIINRAIRIHESIMPRQSDEHAYALAIDERHGGWVGVDGWKEHGYEPFCASYKRHVFTPELEVFHE